MKNKIFLIVAFSLLFFGLISCSSTMINEAYFLPVKSGDFKIVGIMRVETEDVNEKSIFGFIGSNGDKENEMLYFSKEDLFGVSIINREGEELNYKINITFNLENGEKSNVGKIAFILKDPKREKLL